jgi:hypothetical protein
LIGLIFIYTLNQDPKYDPPLWTHPIRSDLVFFPGPSWHCRSHHLCWAFPQGLIPLSRYSAAACFSFTASSTKEPANSEVCLSAFSFVQIFNDVIGDLRHSNFKQQRWTIAAFRFSYLGSLSSSRAFS